MGALIGFVLGYVLGAKAGPESIEELKRAWQTIAASEEFQGLVAAGGAMLANVLGQARGAIAEPAMKLAAGNGDLLRALNEISTNGDLAEIWDRISKSDEFRGVAANAMQLLESVLAQGQALTGGRRMQ